MKVFNPSVIFLFFISIFLFVNCEKDPPPGPGGGGGGGGTGTQDTIYFTVEGITLSNGSVYQINYTDAFIKGEFQSIANTTNPILDYGYVWSTSPNNLTLGSALGSSTNGPRTSPGLFYDTLTSLTPNTTYYVTAYVISNNGTAYHDHPLSFKTLPGAAPDIALGSVSDISYNSATIHNTITDFKGFNVINYGHIWGTSPNIDLSNAGNNKEEYGAVSATDDHAFSTPLSGLNPGQTYYFRAFAENQFGTSYSAPKEFTTDAPPAPNLVVQNFSYTEPNGTGNVNPGETVIFTFYLRNIGNEIANGVTFSIDPSPHYSIETSQPVSIGTILPSDTKPVSVEVKIGSNVPWNTQFTVSATSQDDEFHTWNHDDVDDITVISPYVVSNGLGFYLRFNECSGPTVSSVIGNHTGDLFGPSFSNDVIPGVSSGCSLEFNPLEEDYLQFPLNPMFGYSEASFSFWMKTNTGNLTVLKVASGFRLYIDDNYVHYNSSTDFDYDCINYLDGAWHHFVITLKPDEQRLYIDNALKKQNTSSTGISGTNYNNGFLVGHNEYTQDYSYMNGKLENLRIYNRALTETEVDKIYTNKQ
jgi:hypothetical protein